MAKTKNAKNFMENLLGEPMSFAMLLRSVRNREDLTQNLSVWKELMSSLKS